MSTYKHLGVGYGMIYSGVLLGYGKSQREKFRYLFRLPGMDLEVPVRYGYQYPGVLQVPVLHM